MSKEVSAPLSNSDKPVTHLSKDGVWQMKSAEDKQKFNSVIYLQVVKITPMQEGSESAKTKFKVKYTLSDGVA